MINSKEKLGVYIHKNMDIDTMKSKLEEASKNRPDLLSTIEPFLESIATVSLAVTGNQNLLSEIEDLKANLKVLKRALNIAQKAYNAGNKVSSTLLDTHPAVNGAPPLTGTSLAMTPLEAAVSKTVNSINECEDKIDEKTLALTQSSETTLGSIKNLTSDIIQKLLV